MVLSEFLKEWNNENKCIRVQTSGSTGTPKPMWVEKEKMKVSAEVTCNFLQLKPNDTALLCMPLDYIAGKMMVVRAIVRQLKLITVEPSGHPLATLSEAPDFAAMVPMQVYNSLQVEKERSMFEQIGTIIIGGGAISETLENSLRTMNGRIYSSYGMTETLSHIALRQINGDEASLWYTPLEGVEVTLNNDDCLCIYAPKICKERLTTNDRAIINEQGKFKILGRKDNVIDTGGIKVQAEEVERLLQNAMKAPFAITSQREEKFGEIIVLVTEEEDTASIEKICKDLLPKYWRPKKIIHMAKIPLTETGKIKRVALKNMEDKV